MLRGLRRKLVKLIMLTGAAAVVTFGYAAETAGTTETKNLVDLHVNAGKLSNQECLACHADILKATSLDIKIKTYHPFHLESKRSTPKECADCHESVDLRNGSAGALRKQVNPQVCADCHDGSRRKIPVFYGQ